MGLLEIRSQLHDSIVDSEAERRRARECERTESEEWGRKEGGGGGEGEGGGEGLT